MEEKSRDAGHRIFALLCQTSLMKFNPAFTSGFTIVAGLQDNTPLGQEKLRSSSLAS